MASLGLWLWLLLMCIPTACSRRVVKQAWSSLSPSFTNTNTPVFHEYGYHRNIESHPNATRSNRTSSRRVRVLSDDHRVDGLPGLTSDGGNGIVQYAGLLPCTPDGTGQLFYWLFEASINSEEAPLIIWLNGGPGCSSMDGLFLENGPFKLAYDFSITLNQFSWHKTANVLYIDQPVGTGMSFTTRPNGYPQNDQQVNEQLYFFLQSFLKMHGRFVSDKRSRTIFLTGESHAGHYIPSFAMYAAEANLKSSLHISIGGLAIGNGWVYPLVQYDVSDVAHGLGLITTQQKAALKAQEALCQSALRAGNLDFGVCYQLLDSVISASSTRGGRSVSMYDVRQYLKSQRDFPPAHETVEAYMNLITVRNAVHASATPHKFVECADPPYFALKHQDGKDVMRELQVVLDAGVRVLMYSGQFDLIVHHLGTEKMLQSLEWHGKESYLNSKGGVFMVGDVPAGYVKTASNLIFLVMLGAGHMVPLDSPREALEMITRFIMGKSFEDGQQGLKNIVSSEVRCLPILATVPAPRWQSNPVAVGNGMLVFIEADCPSDPPKSCTLELMTQPGFQYAEFELDSSRSSYYLSGFEDGVPIQFWATLVDSQGRRSDSVPSAIAVPGCVPAEQSVQCCGHGVCAVGAASGEARCFCEEGFQGRFCQNKVAGVNVTSPMWECSTHSSTILNASILGNLSKDLAVLTQNIIPTGSCPQPGKSLCLLKLEFFLFSKKAVLKYADYSGPLTSLLTTDLIASLSVAGSGVQLKREDISLVLDLPTLKDAETDAPGPQLMVKVRATIRTTTREAEFMSTDLNAQLWTPSSPIGRGLASSMIQASSLKISYHPLYNRLRAEGSSIGSGFQSIGVVVVCASLAIAGMMMYRLALRTSASRMRDWTR